MPDPVETWANPCTVLRLRARRVRRRGPLDTSPEAAERRPNRVSPLRALWLILAQACAPALSADKGHVPSAPPQAQAGVPSVTVHRAYVCPGSKSWKARRGRKLVAIDLELRSVDAGLDLDDVELLDAPSGRVLDAAPEAGFLHPDGRFYAWQRAPPSGIERVLLVFEIPSRVNAVRIRLWDDILTPVPITFAASGPALPPGGPGP